MALARQLLFWNTNNDFKGETMIPEKKQLSSESEEIWVISRGSNKKIDLKINAENSQTIFAKEYRISDLGKYLLDPDPIEVQKKLIGCEVHYREPVADKIRNVLRKIFPDVLRRHLKKGSICNETLISDYQLKKCGLKDPNLRLHLEKIQTVLSEYDPVLKALFNLDTDTLVDIVGICEDDGGNRSLLNLKGGLEEKMRYMSVFLLKNVNVVLESAQVADGLFEMSGFDFSRFNPHNAYRLLKFYVQGRPRFCLVDSDGKLEFWVNDIAPVHYMHLLEHSIMANPKFSSALRMCSRNEAKPLRLLFKKHLEIDYHQSPLPSLYKKLFDTFAIESSDQESVIQSLKNSQLGILFNYVPNSNSGKNKLFTNISVMHDVRALKELKEYMPMLYSEISRMASVSEAGVYYLLDHVRGCGDE